ncbi:MAG: hypothetical protein ABR577_03290 [Pyrinomonadaceae bacterium]
MFNRTVDVSEDAPKVNGLFGDMYWCERDLQTFAAAAEGILPECIRPQTAYACPQCFVNLNTIGQSKSP